MTREQSDKLYSLSISVFPHLRGSDAGKNGYWTILRNLDYSPCTKALVRLMREPQQFPVTPGQIVWEKARHEKEQARADRQTVQAIPDPRPQSEEERKQNLKRFQEMLEACPPQVLQRLGLTTERRKRENEQ